MKKIPQQTAQNTGRVSPSTENTTTENAATPSPRSGRVRRLSHADNQQLSDFVEANANGASSHSFVSSPTEQNTDIEHTAHQNPSNDPEVVLGDITSLIKGNPPLETDKSEADHTGKLLESAGKQLENNEGTQEEQASAAKNALSALQKQLGKTGSDKPISEAHAKKLKLLEERIDSLDDKKKLGTCLLNVGLIILQQQPIPLDNKSAIEAKNKLNDLEDESPVEETDAPEESKEAEETDAPEESKEAEETDAPEETKETEETNAPDELDATSDTDEVDGTGATDEIEGNDDDDEDITITIEQNNNWDNTNQAASENTRNTQNEGHFPQTGTTTGEGDGTIGSAGDTNQNPITPETATVENVETQTGTTTGEGTGTDNEGGNDSILLPPETPPPPPAQPKKWKLTPMDSAGISRTRQVGPFIKKQIHFGIPLSQQAAILNSMPKTSSFLNNTPPMDLKEGVTRSSSTFSRLPTIHRRTDFSKNTMEQEKPYETPLYQETRVSGVVRSYTVNAGNSSVASSPTQAIPQEILQENAAGVNTIGQIVNDQRAPLSASATFTDNITNNDEEKNDTD
ncbi:MAG: hypothetical protein ACRCV3_02440 [Desulfovibrionaceae bacterium]